MSIVIFKQSHKRENKGMATYNLDDPGFILAPFFQNRKDAMGFILKVKANKDMVLNFIIQKDDYSSPEQLMDMLSEAVDSLVQNKSLAFK
jgi:hypothetical protein